MSGVPPPVPPLNGLTLDSLGVRETKYVNELVSVNPFSDKIKLHWVSAVVLEAEGVY